jgi:hypothetical protein
MTGLPHLVDRSELAIRFWLRSATRGKE